MSFGSYVIDYVNRYIHSESGEVKSKKECCYNNPNDDIIPIMWFQIISELFVNLAAGWFGVVFIQPYLESIRTPEDILWLLFKTLSGIISLFIAKYLREKSQRRRE